MLLNLRQLAKSPGGDSLIASQPTQIASPPRQPPRTLTDIQFIVTEAMHTDTDTTIEMQMLSA